MADQSNRDALQPSLLDRLTDNAPSAKSEASERSSLNLRQLRRAVMRDLSWLLNTGNLGAIVNLDDVPEVQSSVLNYGMPDMAGMTVSSMDMRSIERLVRNSILRFEPRIIGKTLQVKINLQQDEMNRNALNLDIEGDLWAHPAPLRLHLKTALDLETGEVAVTDASGRS